MHIACVQPAGKSDAEYVLCRSTSFSPKKGFSLWGLLWPEQYIRTELQVFASFQLASPGQSRVMSCIPVAGGCDHMLREPNLLPYSAHPFHIQRELCKGCATQVWFDHVQ